MDTIKAVILAAGSGSRMGCDTPKQYLQLLDKPVMVYALEAFQKSCVDEIVLVVAPGEVSYCKEEIVKKYGITKVSAIVEGGKERYDSVYQGLLEASCDYVLIHDCARACIDQEVIQRAVEYVKKYQACVVAVPSKDTVKLADEDGFVKMTPKRSDVWNVQTPQCFSYPLVRKAYEKLQQSDKTDITDDAMVVEKMLGTPVKLVMGSYENFKITTPEDLLLGERILRERK